MEASGGDTALALVREESMIIAVNEDTTMCANDVIVDCRECRAMIMMGCKYAQMGNRAMQKKPSFFVRLEKVTLSI